MAKATYDPNAPENAPDMSRYHYPPGKTEPELRPEFVDAEEAEEEPEEDVATKKPASKTVAKKK